MDTTQFRKLDQTFVLNVLYQIRAEIVRDGLPNLDAVDALLEARGADPEARLIREPRPRRFKRGKLLRAILRVLQDGPQTTGQIAAKLSNHPGTQNSVQCALRRLVQRGQVCVVVEKCGRTKQVWGLVVYDDGKPTATEPCR